MATKVKSFRVDDDLDREIEKARNASGLSYADLIKLGAGISRSYIESKIDKQKHLQDKIDELVYRIQQKEEELERLSQPFEEQIEKEKARRKKQLEDEIARKKAEFNYRMERSYHELAQITEKIRELKEEKDKLEAQVKSKKAELSQVINDLYEYKQKYNDAGMTNVMMGSMMGLSMLGAVGNITQSLPQSKPASQPTPNLTDTTNLQQWQYSSPQQNISDATTLLTQCLPVLMVGMMANVMASPPKKRPPEVQPPPKPRVDFVKRLKQIKAVRTEPEPEIAKSEAVPKEKEEAEDEEESGDDEEYDED
jgi:hypothetical protein